MSAMATGKHWLYNWMDEFDASDAETAQKRLADPRSVARLREHADGQSDDATSLIPLVGSVLAGPGLDRGMGICHSLSCRQVVIDYDFGVPLHYFDYLVMEGPEARRTKLLDEVKSRSDYKDILRSFADDVGVMAYFRKIGLADYTIFVPKRLPCYCSNHFSSYAKESGFDHLVEEGAIDDLAAKVCREGGMEITRTGPREWSTRLVHPQFASNYRRTYLQKTRPKKKEVAASIIRALVFQAVTETAVARMFGTPMSAVSQPEFLWGESAGDQVSAADVALQLRIPVLDALSTEQLIKLREEEYHHFERFRQIVAQAIASLVDKNKTQPASVLAETVWRDTIRPAALDVERRIAASNRSLARKMATGISVSASTGAVGAVAGFPLIAAAGATAAAATLPVAQLLKYFDDRQQVELNDMYFLWKARKVPTHRHH